ncbi:Cyanovirin-N [Penicillium brevicompactum]|uniref:Cyanovirin-N n=1 Tax=Penicillium brevicompactum TaxID=5074 RepID=A0A9W9R0Z8_PENBR|nr:Cyanovirin-N [Penicillium brevicompactum]
MGFHKSSMDIKLKEGHVLTAYCRRPTGEAIYSELDLDELLGTRKEFAWGYKDFSASSQDVNLELEGPTNEPMLHAKVDDGVGHLRESEVNLAGCIKNIDGNLRFMDCF